MQTWLLPTRYQPPAWRWHGSSEFGPGPCNRPADPQRFYELAARALRAAKQLGVKELLAALALLTFIGQDGRCYPSHAAIAERAGCSTKTVARAFNKLREHGLLRWQRRLKRTCRGTAQTSNAYVFSDRAPNVHQGLSTSSLPLEKETRPFSPIVWQHPAASPEQKAARERIEGRFRGLPWLAAAYARALE